MNSHKKKAIQIVKEAGIKITIRNLRYYSGSYNYFSNTMILSKRMLKTRDFVSAVFHELGHDYCYKKRIYPAYHNLKFDCNLTRKEKKASILTAWKAEQYVDRWARREMKKHFPNIIYKPGYTTEQEKKWLLDYTKKCLN